MFHAVPRSMRNGVAYGVAAYGVWGLFPLYLRLIDRTPAVEILAHRIIWSLVVLLLLISIDQRWSRIRRFVGEFRQFGLLTAAATVIALNWGVFIYAVNTDRVLEASLGYFTTPLISVLLGVVILREQLRSWQWAAVTLGVLALLILIITYGQMPWIALVLAITFGTYGLLKKLANVPVLEALTIEMLVLLLPALGCASALEINGSATFDHVSAEHALLLVGTGAVFTAVPFMLFSAALSLMRLTVIGILQYLNPALQFFVGLWVLHEAMPTSRWLGFGLVWLALAVFSADGIRAAKT
jgi:chloramphenicol-sensitive protein RarD